MLEVAITSLKCALRDEYPEFREFYEAKPWEPAPQPTEENPAAVDNTAEANAEGEKNAEGEANTEGEANAETTTEANNEIAPETAPEVAPETAPEVAPEVASEESVIREDGSFAEENTLSVFDSANRGNGATGENDA